MNGLLRHWVNKIRSRKPRILTRQIRCADQVHQTARSKVSLPDTGCRFLPLLHSTARSENRPPARRKSGRTLYGRCRLCSVRLPFFSSPADSDVRSAVAADSIPSVFRSSRPWRTPMYASRSLQTLFRPSSVLLVHGRIRCTLRGRCVLYSVRLPYFSSTVESDARFAVAADSVPSIFRTSRPWQNPMYASRSLQTLFRPPFVLLVHGISHVPRVKQLSCGPHSRRFSVWAQRKPTPRIRERHF